MSKRVFIGVMVVAIAVVLTAGGLLASNMGFKLNRTLSFTGTVNGTNTLALPWNRQSGIDTASALKTDIGATCIDVQRFNPATNTLQIYAGGRSDPNFALSKGEGYRVRVNANTQYIVVGSHDPSFTVNFQFTGTVNGTNEYAMPYHATVTNAAGLKTQIGATCVDVQRFVPATNTLQIYAGGRSDPNFALTPGESYRVRVNADTPYNPAHY